MKHIIVIFLAVFAFGCATPQQKEPMLYAPSDLFRGIWNSGKVKGMEYLSDKKYKSLAKGFAAQHRPDVDLSTFTGSGVYTRDVLIKEDGTPYGLTHERTRDVTVSFYRKDPKDPKSEETLSILLDLTGKYLGIKSNIMKVHNTPTDGAPW